MVCHIASWQPPPSPPSAQEFLRKEELAPTSRFLKSRLNETDGFGRLRSVKLTYDAWVALLVERRAALVEGEYLLPARSRGGGGGEHWWVDHMVPPAEPPGREEWRELLSYLNSGRPHSENGMVAFARELRRSGPPFVRRLSLGRALQLVVLLLSRQCITKRARTLAVAPAALAAEVKRTEKVGRRAVGGDGKKLAAGKPEPEPEPEEREREQETDPGQEPEPEPERAATSAATSAETSAATSAVTSAVTSAPCASLLVHFTPAEMRLFEPQALLQLQHSYRWTCASHLRALADLCFRAEEQKRNFAHECNRWSHMWSSQATG